MSPAPYLFHVNSQPYVSPECWRQWYIQEHFPDLLNSGCVVRAALYEEADVSSNDSSDHHRKFLGLWQTDYPDLLKSEPIRHVRLSSELFAKEGSTTDQSIENGDFNARNFKLVQDYNPLGSSETASPYIVTVEMHPKDVEDFDKWYREEHLNMMQEVPGNRRCLRYKFDSRSVLTKGDFQPDFLAVYEFDDLRGWGGKELIAATSTPWSLKHAKETEAMIVRVWKLTHSLGYEQ